MAVREQFIARGNENSGTPYCLTKRIMNLVGRSVDHDALFFPGCCTHLVVAPLTLLKLSLTTALEQLPSYAKTSCFVRPILPKKCEG